MRILYIIPGKIVGGAELRTFKLCADIKKFGHDTFIAGGNGLCVDIVKNYDIPYFFLPIKTNNLNLFHILLSLNPLLKIIKKNKVDILVTYRRSAAFLAFIASKLSGTPHIYTSVSVFQRKTWIKFKCDFLIGNSRASLKNAFNYIDAPRNQHKVIYRGVDLPSILLTRDEARNILRIESDVTVIGFSGRLSEEKGIDILLKAFANIHKLYHNTKLLIIGEGKKRLALEKMRHLLGLSEQDVIFLGWREDLWGILPAVDIFVNAATKNESLSNSLLEAAACGIPLVGTTVGGMPELILHERNGLLVPPLDIRALETAIIYLINNFDLRIRMGEQAKSIVKQKFSKENEVLEYISVFESLVKNKTKPKEEKSIVNILNTKITNLSMVALLKELESVIQKKNEFIQIVTPNVDHIIKLQKDYEFKTIYDNADYVLTDGVPLIWAAKFLGTPLREKISGSDLFPKLCEIASKKCYRLFFLGGREGAVEKAKEVFKKKYPNIQIVGIYCPPSLFVNDETENRKIVKMIRDTKTDILFVGLGAPKQEKWIYKYKDQYQVPVSIGIGASFDFVADLVKRAPVWMQKAGFEWFWRLLMEPRRLCKRYLIEDVFFFWLILKQKFKRQGWR